MDTVIATSPSYQRFDNRCYGACPLDLHVYAVHPLLLSLAPKVPWDADAKVVAHVMID